MSSWSAMTPDDPVPPNLLEKVMILNYMGHSIPNQQKKILPL